MVRRLCLFLSHCIALSPLTSARCIRCTVWGSFIFFSSLLLLIIPRCEHPLLKLDNQETMNTSRGTSAHTAHVISVWQTHAEICWQWCQCSSCETDSLLFLWESKKKRQRRKWRRRSRRNNPWRLAALGLISAAFKPCRLSEYLMKSQSSLLWNIPPMLHRKLWQHSAVKYFSSPCCRENLHICKHHLTGVAWEQKGIYLIILIIITA